MHPDADGFLTRAAASAAGYSDDEFRRMIASGEIRKVATGIYCPADRFDALTPTGVHRLRAVAAVRGKRGHAVSHVSAAVLHGLTMWNTDLGRVHLTADRATGARRTSSLHVHTGRLTPSTTVELGSVPVTSPARTIVDTARVLDLDHAVVIGDSALRKFAITPDALADALERSSRLHNIAAARRAVHRMNGLSESAGESLSRLRMEEHGIPTPTLQYRVPLLDFRVDFFWPKLRIIGEFDGLGKYGGDSRTLAREKAREDALRDEGYQVIRWVWRDLWNFAEVFMRFERARARALMS
ncbi:hypothetical protein [Rhodococcoides fascians]|uniref:hypothetical protein n=1 Tax=Rhodococcoides fascians TaxID=1828 RepID=UPI0005630904|nr:hypothetical protein [Rhodococcus fascians]